MREALAAADHDFVLVEPASKSKRTRGKTSGAKRRAASRPIRRYRGIVLSALCAATVACILVNALMLQKSRHPAPLFGRAAPRAGAKEPPVAETIPLPAPRPSSNGAGATANDKSQVERPQVERPQAERLQADQASSDRAGSGRVHAPPAEASEPAPLDPIAQLLKMPTPAREENATASSAQTKSAIAAAQRALMKLGYVLEEDGIAGATTKQAIERYERDRGLPVNAELTPRLLRRLSAESGLSIP